MSIRTVVGSRRGGLTVLALVAVAAGLLLVVVALTHQQSAAPPPRSVGRIDSSPPPTAAPSAAPSLAPSLVAPRRLPHAPLGASRPVHISIPVIKVSSQVRPIGLTPAGALAVPQPGPDLDKAAWFKNSPTPGQPGPSIIEGHVDSEAGPSVFLRLGALRPGDAIRVTRADGVETVFTVNAVRDFPKSRFPSDVVYGGKDLSTPQLRLITCSDFDRSIRHHTGNAVIFAHLTAVHRPHPLR